MLNTWTNGNVFFLNLLRLIKYMRNRGLFSLLNCTVRPNICERDRNRNLNKDLLLNRLLKLWASVREYNTMKTKFHWEVRESFTTLYSMLADVYARVCDMNDINFSVCMGRSFCFTWNVHSLWMEFTERNSWEIFFAWLGKLGVKCLRVVLVFEKLKFSYHTPCFHFIHSER